MTDNAPTAALLIIGNEILSGRTQDTNTQNIAERLTNHGIRLIQVRVVPDIKDIIIHHVSELKGKADYLLTTGGIGPTHDDITAESIAEAFGVELELNPEARAMLLAHYGNESDLTDARLKMAMIPQGAGLIKNPVSGAPGFIMENVYTMAGVPRIMLSMLDEILAMVKTGPKILSNSVSCNLGESAVAEGLENIQKQYDDVEIGSYPHYRAGTLGLSLVLRSTDPARLDEATLKVVALIRSLGSEPGAISLQSEK